LIPELILLALLAGWIFGGKFWRLADAKIRHAWLIFVPVSFYVISWGAAYFVSTHKLGWLFGFFAISEKIALIAFAAINVRLPGTKLIVIGLLLNLIAVSANHGMMPADPDDLAIVYGKGYVASAKAAPHIRSAVMDASTELSFLCDIIAAKRPFVLIPAVFSVGDLVMGAGIMLAIIALMRTPLPQERKRVSVETAPE
jgi:hypothetical protein